MVLSTEVIYYTFAALHVKVIVNIEKCLQLISKLVVLVPHSLASTHLPLHRRFRVNNLTSHEYRLHVTMQFQSIIAIYLSSRMICNLGFVFTIALL